MAMAMDVNKGTMDALLKAEKGWRLTDNHAGEYVYEFPLSTRPNVVVKVFSTISKKNDIRRKRGQDAIRICAVDTKANKGIVKSRRVLRVPTWRDNLTKAVTEVFKLAQERARQWNL